MSIIETYRKNITRKREELTRLANDRAKENSKIAAECKKIDSARSAINRTKNSTTIKNRTRDIEKAEKGISDSRKKLAAIESKVSKLEKEISDEQKKLNREELREQNRRHKKEVENQKKTQTQLASMNKTLQLHENNQFNLQNQIDALKKIPEKITVLFLAANPKDTNALRLGEEAREIQDMIRRSEYRDTITFESRWAVRTIDILQAINEVNPDIIHFSGHGSFEGDLVFEDHFGKTKAVPVEAMTQTISTVSDKVRFIFFNACFSSVQAQEIVEHVEATIGMNSSISDTAAIVFASQFYSSIGFGKSIQNAYEQAKASLMMEVFEEKDIPELYVRSDLMADHIFLVRPELDEISV